MENFVVYSTMIGNIKIGYINHVVTMIQKVEEDETFENRNLFTDDVYVQLQEYFSGKRKKFDFDLEIKGTEFQKKVWYELLKIPYGEVITYKELAKRVGNDKASRAVGNANNKNKIGIVILCHRVIGSNHKLVGYAGGLDMKQFLIELEIKNSGK